MRRPGRCRAGQVAVVRLPDGGVSAGHQPEHRAAGVPVDGLGGSQAADWVAVTDSVHAIGRLGAESTLVDRSRKLETRRIACLSPASAAIRRPGTDLYLGTYLQGISSPDPARFALHKLIVSTLRDPSRAAKADKDRRQASVLIDALMEKFPDRLAVAADQLDEAARAKVADASALTLRLGQDLSERTRDFLANLGR